jgi:hypothetical protein
MASLLDKITDIRNGARPVTTTVSSPRSVGGGTLSCASLTGWPTASKVHFVTYQIDSNSNPIAGTQLDCEGIVSGSDIGSFTVNDGNDIGHSVGDVVEMLPTAAWGQDLAEGLIVGHTRTGAHAASLPLTSPVLTTPVIADFSSATHTHASNAQGGKITSAGITSFDTSLTTISNPYKFSVHLAADQTGVVDNVSTKVAFDTEKFDTNSNFASNKYTAPVAGFYQINAYVCMLSPGNTAAVGNIFLYKNGANIQEGGHLYPAVSVGASVYLSGNISHLVQLAANDTLEIYVNMDVTSDAVTVVGGATNTTFSGFLVSQT